MEKEYSYIDVRKERLNGEIIERVYCFYWDYSTEIPQRKADVFVNNDYYMYVDKTEFEELENTSKKNTGPSNIYIREYRSDDKTYIAINGKECVRVEPLTSLNSEEYRKWRDQFKITYESDMKGVTRWISKHKPQYAKKVRKIYLDIETIKTPSGEYSSPEDAQAPIVSICCYDNFTEKYTIFCYKETELKIGDMRISKDEKNMMIDFKNFIKQITPDYILGWYIENFDIPYILKRLENMNLKTEDISQINRVYYRKNIGVDAHKFTSYFINICGCGVFDLFAGASRIWLGKYCGYSLESMSQYYLKYGKDKIGDTTSAYEKDFDNLLKYNKKDVQLCVELDEKLSIFKTFQSFQDIISINVDKSITQSSNIVAYLLQKTDTILLNSNKKAEVNTFEGGKVLDTQKGIYKNAYKFDFVSMYPSIILTYNISPDTILDHDTNDCISMDNRYFFSKQEGIITKIIKMLYEERIKHKKSKNKDLSLAYKLIMNTVYGQFAAPYSRFFNFNCAKAITYQGRRLLNILIPLIEKEFNGKIILGDTDSFVFYSEKTVDPSEIIKRAEEVFEQIYKQDKVYEKRLTLEMEKKIDKMIIFGSSNKNIKKKYIEYSDGETKLVGLDCIKSDTQEIAKELQHDLIKYVIDFDCIFRKDMHNIINVYEEKFQKAIFDHDYEYIAIPAKINKEIEDYTSHTFSLKAIKNSGLKVAMNERFFIIMTTQGPLAFKDVSDLNTKHFLIDKPYMWDRIKRKADIFIDLTPSPQLSLKEFI